MKFNDRLEASKLLAQKLKHYQNEPQALILGLPRGGIPIASTLSDFLHVPWDILLIRKLGVPLNPELAFGAVAADGECVFEPGVLKYYPLSEENIEAVKQKELEELRRRERVYGKREINLAGKIVILTDDGIATGSTMHAAINFVKKQKPSKLVIAVPVIARSTYTYFEMQPTVDELVSVWIPEDLGAIGYFYKDFAQLTDEEALSYLRKRR